MAETVQKQNHAYTYGNVVIGLYHLCLKCYLKLGLQYFYRMILSTICSAIGGDIQEAHGGDTGPADKRVGGILWKEKFKPLLVHR